MSELEQGGCVPVCRSPRSYFSCLPVTDARLADTTYLCYWSGRFLWHGHSIHIRYIAIVDPPGLTVINVNISTRCHFSECEHQPQVSLFPMWISAPDLIIATVNISPRCHCSECEHQPKVSLFTLWTSAPGVIVPTVDINPRFPCYHWISTLGFPVIIGYQPLVSLLSLDINPRFPCCHCGYQP